MKLTFHYIYLCDYRQTLFRIAHLFGVSEEAFLRVTDQMMTGLISKIHQIIRWPTAAELDSFADEFEYIGRQVSISYKWKSASHFCTVNVCTTICPHSRVSASLSAKFSGIYAGYWTLTNVLSPVQCPLHTNCFVQVCFLFLNRFLPNVVGAIDDIHLEIKISDERRHADAFYCWKLYHSIHLQVGTQMFTNCTLAAYVYLIISICSLL